MLSATTHAPPPVASRAAARAATASGAAEHDRTLGQTPADAVGDTTKTSMVDEYVEHGRLCAATDRAKLEGRVHVKERVDEQPVHTAVTATTTATAATTLDGTAVAAKAASVTTTPSLTKAVRRARRR